MTTKEYIRFSVKERTEHFSIMVLFTVLAVTGLPQKFFENSLSQSILRLLGGVDRARLFHRTAGIMFSALALWHLGRVAFDTIQGRSRLSMVPARKDFNDAILTLRYYLGLTEQQARFDRYDYRQKFEYWGLILGAVIVISTGIILYWPVVAARFLPGEFIPAAKVAHSN
jgi:cytochrome b subunit of formate dehydrogenase